MKRTILALVTTVAVVVYLLTYKTVPLTSATPAAAAPPGSTGETITGDTVQVEDHGPLVVTLYVEGGKVVRAAAVQESTSARSREISERALPRLDAEALTVESDGFDAVSGATLTSEAYETSLQSALDRLA
ncbi:FMN-binding protein [Nonomuraea sp. NPDC050790]|uniref:FMN-binding protein n=1 Tax=Nonomuraea sp. NPDC050790 TaxID=3364371 RepID=UPI0037B9968C